MRILNTAVPGTKRLSLNMDILSDYVRMKPFVGELGVRNNGKTNITTTLAPRVSWLGHRKRHIHRIASGEIVDVHLQAVFSEPGVYDLNRFQFTLLRGLNGAGRNTMFLFPYQYLISVCNTSKRDNEDVSLLDFEDTKSTTLSSVISTKEEISEEKDLLGLFCDDTTSTPVVKTEDLFDRDAPRSSSDVLGSSNNDVSRSSSNIGTPSNTNEAFDEIGDSFFDLKTSNSAPTKEDSSTSLGGIDDSNVAVVEEDGAQSLNSDDLDMLFSNAPAT